MLPVGPKPKFVDPAKLFAPYLKMDLRVWSFRAPVKISIKHAISAYGTKFHERKKIAYHLSSDDSVTGNSEAVTCNENQTFELVFIDFNTHYYPNRMQT
jgi:hypothetical protein